jgi:hypothetical protein
MRNLPGGAAGGGIVTFVVVGCAGRTGVGFDVGTTVVVTATVIGRLFPSVVGDKPLQPAKREKTATMTRRIPIALWFIPGSPETVITTRIYLNVIIMG